MAKNDLQRGGEERPGFPFGKPKPYTPDHVNHLLVEPPKYQASGTITMVSTIGQYFLTLLALLMIGYGCHGWLVDDLWLPRKYSGGDHYHGTSAFLMFMMLASLGGGIIVVAFDRVDLARMRMKGKLLSNLLFAAGMLFMVAGIILSNVWKI